MEKPEVKPGRVKAKNKKPPAKPKNAKKKKSDGPTCSMFLSELTRKLAAKRREQQMLLEEAVPTNNIIHSIISSLTNALPVVFSKKSPDRLASPVDIQQLSPELIELNPNENVQVVLPPQDAALMADEEHYSPNKGGSHKIPKMPLINSDVLKMPERKRDPAMMADASVNTGHGRDVATELAQHVGTLKKISLIAEEFNQKTAKNLKEIVDSVQIDLIKKLEEIQAEEANNFDSNKIAQSLMQQVVEKS